MPSWWSRVTVRGSRRPHLAPVAVAAAAPVEGSTPKAPPVTQQKLRLEPRIFVLEFKNSKVDQPTNQPILSTNQPTLSTNQPTLSSFWSTCFLDPGNGWSFSQVPSLFDGPLRLQLQRLRRLPQLLRRRYRHAPSTWDASLRRRAASGEGLE